MLALSLCRSLVLAVLSLPPIARATVLPKTLFGSLGLENPTRRDTLRSVYGREASTNASSVTSQIGSALVSFIDALEDEGYFQHDADRINKRDNPHTIEKRAISCNQCKALLSTAKVGAALGNNAFTSIIVEICELANLATSTTCSGAIGLQAPIIASVLRNTGADTTRAAICSGVVNACSMPDASVYGGPLNPVKTSPPASFPQLKTSGSTYKVLHLSDIHIDQSYTVGAESVCSDNVCCRPDSKLTSGSTSIPAGPWGESTCDSAPSLEKSAISYIKNNLNIDFGIFTGDVVEGAIWVEGDPSDKATILPNLQDTFGTQLAALGVKLYPTVGNHDSGPVNNFPPASIDTTYENSWLYSQLNNLWAPWIGSSSTVAANGVYSVKHANTNLRIISLNTMLPYVQNWWIWRDLSENDFDGMLAWLVDELQKAETAGERVWILGHIPPGSADILSYWSASYDLVIKRYANTIAASFYGHTHKDEFQLSFSAKSEPINVNFIEPCLTPTGGNPSFRIYEIDTNTFQVMDYTQYVADWSQLPTWTQTGQVTWKPLYSARDTYASAIGGWPAATALNAPFWDKVSTAFSTNQTLFDTWYFYRTHGTGAKVAGACTGSCLTETVCNIRTSISADACSRKTSIFKRDVVDAANATGHSHTACGPDPQEILGGLRAANEAGLLEKLKGRVDPVQGTDLD